MLQALESSYTGFDKVSEKEKKQKKKKITDGQSTPLSSSPRQPTPVPEQYGGL